MEAARRASPCPMPPAPISAIWRLLFGEVSGECMSAPMPPQLSSPPDPNERFSYRNSSDCTAMPGRLRGTQTRRLLSPAYGNGWNVPNSGGDRNGRYIAGVEKIPRSWLQAGLPERDGRQDCSG